MGATSLVVVDTDVVSLIFKNHSLAPAYHTLLAGRPLAVSLITLGLPSSRSDAPFSGTFHDPPTRHGYSARVGADQERLREEGRPITFADAWIAAAAVHFNVPLVTHNAADYRAVDDLTLLTAPAQ